MRLLLIEDDFRIASFVCKGMTEAGYVVEHTSNGTVGLNMALDNTYDAAIIDLMLPGRDGLEIIDELRRQEKRLPVIILSARRSVDERIRGLQAGGDDYLTKPFSFAELLARVQALIRRANETSQPTGLKVGELSIDLLTHEVVRGARRIPLQPREFALLEYLMRNTGRIVSKTMIMEHVWDYNFDPHTNVVESRICRLREKVDRGFDAPMIHTVRGLGYVLRSPS